MKVLSGSDRGLPIRPPRGAAIPARLARARRWPFMPGRLVVSAGDGRRRGLLYLPPEFCYLENERVSQPPQLLCDSAARAA